MTQEMKEMHVLQGVTTLHTKEASQPPVAKSTERMEQILRKCNFSLNPQNFQEPPQEVFSFEKECVKALKFQEPCTFDINDESIEKIKAEVLEQYEVAVKRRRRLLRFFKFITIVALAVVALEILAVFCILLHLSFKTIPPIQLILWIGSEITLCLGQLFLMIKAYTTLYLKEEQEFLRFLRYTRVFAITYFLLTIALTCSVFIPDLSLIWNVTHEQCEILFKVKASILALIITKVVLQIALHCVTRMLKKNDKNAENPFKMPPPLTDRRLKDGSMVM